MGYKNERKNILKYIWFCFCCDSALILFQTWTKIIFILMIFTSMVEWSGFFLDRHVYSFFTKISLSHDRCSRAAAHCGRNICKKKTKKKTFFVQSGSNHLLIFDFRRNQSKSSVKKCKGGVYSDERQWYKFQCFDKNLWTKIKKLKLKINEIQKKN